MSVSCSLTASQPVQRDPEMGQISGLNADVSKPSDSGDSRALGGKVPEKGSRNRR